MAEGLLKSIYSPSLLRSVFPRLLYTDSSAAGSPKTQRAHTHACLCMAAVYGCGCDERFSRDTMRFDCVYVYGARDYILKWPPTPPAASATTRAKLLTKILFQFTLNGFGQTLYCNCYTTVVALYRYLCWWCTSTQTHRLFLYSPPPTHRHSITHFFTRSLDRTFRFGLLYVLYLLCKTTTNHRQPPYIYLLP